MLGPRCRGSRGRPVFLPALFATQPAAPRSRGALTSATTRSPGPPPSSGSRRTWKRSPGIAGAAAGRLRRGRYWGVWLGWVGGWMTGLACRQAPAARVGGSGSGGGGDSLGAGTSDRGAPLAPWLLLFDEEPGRARALGCRPGRESPARSISRSLALWSPGRYVQRPVQPASRSAGAEQSRAAAPGRRALPAHLCRGLRSVDCARCEDMPKDAALAPRTCEAAAAAQVAAARVRALGAAGLLAGWWWPQRPGAFNEWRCR